MRGRLVALLLALSPAAAVLTTNEACSPTPDCNCPLIADQVEIVVETSCTSVPLVSTQLTGPCTLANPDSSDELGTEVCAGYSIVLAVETSQPGTCGIAMTFANGFTWAISMPVEWRSLPCGSDPSGCGQELSASLMTFIVDACTEAGASDAASE
jgi:hypothetical protein